MLKILRLFNLGNKNQVEDVRIPVRKMTKVELEEVKAYSREMGQCGCCGKRGKYER